MELRKQQEATHYDNLARRWAKEKTEKNGETDVEALEHRVFASYRFCEEWMKNHIKKGDRVLDYGCGNGIHSMLPAELGGQVIGIDLSRESLKIARLRAEKQGVAHITRFLSMDCEKLAFRSRSFDVVFDGGTFSSLDLAKAIPEIARVVKPKGALIAIETLGHNPLTNLKRKLNKMRGKRTGWAVDHIFKMSDIALIKNHFNHVETHYFNLLSLIAFPFRTLPGGPFFLHALEAIDSILLKFPPLKRYAFKIVIVASQPRTSF